MDSLTLTTGGAALVTALLLQYLKKVPWVKVLGIEPQYATMNFIVSVIAAGLVSLGVGYSYDEKTGIVALTLSTHQLWHWLIQWVSQHVIYKTTIVPTELLAAGINELKIISSELVAAKEKGDK